MSNQEQFKQEQFKQEQFKQEQFKFARIVDQAGTAFWETVVKNYPEAKTGDLSPIQVHDLEMAMTKALTEWLDNNIPASQTLI